VQKQTTFELTIRSDWCKSCGYCVALCPEQVLAYAETLNARGVHPVVVAHPDKCTGCRTCVVMCPDLVFEVRKNGSD
jgi:2-oxoglutarate ferredoxin oxidoreductase subunit delta